ncbi:MAG TPA: type II secretion system protein, partial [Telluria sp.]|nr:type II secretion system protein [Telluria sp.]
GDHVGVLGVYSLSQAQPLKIGNFDARFVGFENKQRLSDWKFMPQGVIAPVLATVPAPAAASLFASSPASSPRDARPGETAETAPHDASEER